MRLRLFILYALTALREIHAYPTTSYTKLYYSTEGHRADNQPWDEIIYGCPPTFYICQFDAGEYNTRLGWIGFYCCTWDYVDYATWDDHRFGTLTYNSNGLIGINGRFYESWFARGVSIPVNNLYSTVADAVNVGFTKMKVRWDSCSVCGVYYQPATATTYNQDTLVDPMKCGGCSTPKTDDLECANYQKIVGVYGYTHDNDCVYGLTFFCTPITCGPADTNVLKCTCPAGKYKADPFNGGCQTCPVGQYSASANLRGCSYCSAGGAPIPGSSDRTFTGTIYTSPPGMASDSCTYTCDVGYEGVGTYCTPCKAGYYKTTQGTIACTACAAGSASSVVGRTTPCTACSPSDSTPHYQNQPGQSSCNDCTPTTAAINYYVIPCTSTSDAISTPCPRCNAGTQLAVACPAGNTLTSPPACVACPAGTFQSQNNALAAVCSICPVAKYTTLTGQPGCLDCAAAPANSVYIAPTSAAQASTSACPFTCNAGYYTVGRTCATCTLGNYALNSALVSCTPNPPNSYLLTPILFNCTYDGCPWDCNAGYYRTAGKACAPCTAGSTFAAASAMRTMDSALPNTCTPCTTCSLDATNPLRSSYESSPCTVTSNRICTACKTTCNAGFYVGTCTLTSNTACLPCKTSCPSGSYISGFCSGTQASDVITCIPCTSYTTCRPGTFIPSNQCPGNTYADVLCRRCTDLSCAYGFYEQNCNQTQDKQCVAYTKCPAGQYLTSRSATSDGTCVTCTACSSTPGLSTLAPCAAYTDTVCGGIRCNQSNPCAANYFCNPISSTCGRCPDGYSSDGLACIACPRLYTCNRLGAIQCSWELPPGAEPGCYGRYAAYKADCPFTIIANRVPTRGTFVNPNGNCAPYFDCIPGYYKLFGATGTLTCDLCTNTPPVNWAYFSQGLAPNDPTSCLLECAQLSTWPGGTCSLTSTPQTNAEAYYAGTTRCPLGFTSQPNAAQSLSDCLPCPTSSAILGDPCYAWTCNGNNMVRRGNKCYSVSLCPSPIGYYQDLTGACIAMPLPWQPQGNLRTGVSLAYYPATGGAALNITSLKLQGAVCSSAVSGYYTFVVFCNQSFVSFVDSRYSPTRARLLIGQPTAGYQEGFRDTALFASQLFIALDPLGANIYLADTLNCVLRVIEFTTPGLYTTRSHLLSGTPGTCTDLQYPGRILPLLASKYFLFPSQAGLHMVDDATRSVQLIVAAGSVPGGVNLYQLTAASATSATQVIRAHGAPCVVF